MSSKYANFDTTINGVDVNVEAEIYDGEIDEFTVYVGDIIVNEILSDAVIDKLQQEALYEVSDEMTLLTIADDKWKEKGEQKYEYF